VQNRSLRSVCGKLEKTVGVIQELVGKIGKVEKCLRRIDTSPPNSKTGEVNPMEQSVFEHVGRQIDDTTHKATRAASAVADALEDSVSAARRKVRDGADAATELIYDTKKRVQRHPLETIAITFAVGIAAGTLLGWLIKRETSQKQSD